MSTINLYNSQTEHMSNLQKAQDAITYDPGSVNQQNKLIDLQKKYADSITKLNSINKSLRTAQIKTSQEIENTGKDIKSYKKTLELNNQLFDKYNQDIQDKMQSVATRDRMLQLSQERNSYKKKIIYILISIVITLIIAIISGYTIFSKMSRK